MIPSNALIHDSDIAHAQTLVSTSKGSTTHLRYPGVVLLLAFLLAALWIGQSARGFDVSTGDAQAGENTQVVKTESQPQVVSAIQSMTRMQALVASLTVFVLAVFVGFEIIAKVPPTLHTPLMSGSNAISGIAVVGALVAAGHHVGGFGSFLGFLAVIAAMVNVVGGFLVTHRMLMMFKRK